MLDWNESPHGFRVDRYEIILDEPQRWRLVVSGRPLSWHPTATAAKKEAQRREGIRRRNASLFRLGVAMAAVVGALAVTWSVRFEVNPARQSAEILLPQLEAAYQAIEGGSASVTGYANPESGVEGDLVVLSDGREYAVLVGEAGGECYSVAWTPGGVRRARVLTDSLPCVPTKTAIGTSEYSLKRQTPVWSRHLGWLAGDFSWDNLLPPPTQQRVWFIPAVLLLSAVALRILIRASVILLTGKVNPRRISSVPRSAMEI